MEDGHILVRRDHIDVVGLNMGAILDLKDLHGGGALEQFHHEPLWVGSRCWTTTKAKPLSAGTCRKNRSSASSPPAEAPIPTMGTRGTAPGTSVGRGRLVCARGSPPFFALRLIGDG